MSRIHARAAVLALLAAPATAQAHHAMDGTVAQTVWQGVASGLAHPVLGLDHLAFLLAAGVLAAALPRLGARALLAFLATGLLGALLHLGGVGLGPVEAVVAASALVAGMVLLTRQAWRRAPTTSALIAAGVAAAGLFHGHAFAAAVEGAPAPVVAAHLLALALAQTALTFGAMALARRLAAAGRPAAVAGLPVRATGAMAVAVGVVSLAATVLD